MIPIGCPRKGIRPLRSLAVMFRCCLGSKSRLEFSCDAGRIARGVAGPAANSEVRVARRPNYGFQKQQQAIKKQKKRDEKAEKKRLKKEAAQESASQNEDVAAEDEVT